MAEHEDDGNDGELVNKILSEMNNVEQPQQPPQQPFYTQQIQQHPQQYQPQPQRPPMYKKSRLNKLMVNAKKDLKYIVIVALLVLVSSLPATNSFITKFVPKTSSGDDNNINMFGIIIKSLLAGLVYYLTKCIL